MPQMLSALEYAEQYDYDNLLTVLRILPVQAQQTDDFGMTPLHWVCSDTNVSVSALVELVHAHPQATAVANLAGLLPLHIALRKDLPLEALKTLLKHNPNSMITATPEGKTPLELAKDHITSRSVGIFLRMMETEVRAAGFEPFDEKPLTDSGFSTMSSTNNSSVRTQSSRSEMRMPNFGSSAPVLGPIASTIAGHTPSTATEAPPMWKLDKCCHICATKFSMFKTRHHCRNCGESVCGKHSKKSLPLQHLGFPERQRVCNICFDRVQAHYNTRAILRANSYYHYDGDAIMATTSLAEALALESRSSRSHSTSSGKLTNVHSVFSRSQDPMFGSSSTWFMDPPPSSTSSRSRNGSSPRRPAYAAVASMGSIHLRRLLQESKRETAIENIDEDAVPTQRLRCRRLAQTEIDTSSSRLPLECASETAHRMDNQVEELNEQIARLVRAKEQIGEALEQSRQQIECARQKKQQYDDIAKEYEERGYSPSPIRAAKSSDCNVPERDEYDDDASSMQANDRDDCIDMDEFNPQDYDSTDSIESYLTFSMSSFSSTPRHSFFMPPKPEVEPAFDLPGTHRDLGVVLLSRNDFAGAAVEFEKCITLLPESATTWYYLAKALDGKGDLAGAEKAVQTALKLEGDTLPCLSLLGKLLHLRGDHDEAIVVFRRALKVQCPVTSKDDKAEQQEEAPLGRW